MQFLTQLEWREWCDQRRIPLQVREWLRPNLEDEPYTTVDIPYPSDSGKKVHLARFLFSLVKSGPNVLLLPDDFHVWPSSQHMPLFTRFREAFGEKRDLLDSKGHLVTAEEEDDAVSIIVIALEFIWDCYGFSSSGDDAFYFSHDEYCYFASRNRATAERVANQIPDLGVH